MEEKDFQRIEQMFGKSVKAEVSSVKEEIKAVKAEVSGVKEEIKAVKVEVGSFREEIDAKLGQFRKEFREEINEDFRHHVGILTEDFQHKLQFAAEGHQMLSEKMERMRNEINNKIDAVAADLAAHRADTEGHKRGYIV